MKKEKLRRKPCHDGDGARHEQNFIKDSTEEAKKSKFSPFLFALFKTPKGFLRYTAF